MKFSQRIGKTPATKLIQIEEIDSDLKNSLWNAIKLFLIDPLKTYSQFGRDSELDTVCQIFWINFYKLPIDTIVGSEYDKKHYIRQRFFQFQWYEIYDFVEFISNMNNNTIQFDSYGFRNFCNVILERENSGYRFIEDNIAPITNETEIKEIEQAIGKSGQFTALKGVNVHLNAALDKLSDKKNPDYRNSIKESISAVESVAKKISDNDKDTLGGALDKIKGKIKLHQSLEQGFKKIYGYTSDSDGIRHALIDENAADFADAKFMLVSCSAFINYLITKAEKAGISFDK